VPESTGPCSIWKTISTKRVDPRRLVEGAKSVISVLHNYYPRAKQEDDEAPVLSKYAYGKDYHFVIKEKLKAA
jgi:epoxyqueuosine reductase